MEFCDPTLRLGGTPIPPLPTQDHPSFPFPAYVLPSIPHLTSTWCRPHLLPHPQPLPACCIFCCPYLRRRTGCCSFLLTFTVCWEEGGSGAAIVCVCSLMCRFVVPLTCMTCPTTFCGVVWLWRTLPHTIPCCALPAYLPQHAYLPTMFPFPTVYVYVVPTLPSPVPSWVYSHLLLPTSLPCHSGWLLTT